jgi:hypothetical protein
MEDFGVPAWRRSTKCEAGSCVEVANLDQRVGMRNSTQPEMSLAFSVESWREFVAAVRAGEFDRQPA